MTASIRRGTPHDARDLARLRWDFRVEYGTHVTRSSERFLEEFLEFALDALVEGSPWRGWVAEVDRRLVGCV